MNFKYFLIFLIVYKVHADILDENFLYHIKSKALPILQPYAPIYYIRVATLLANGAFDSIAPYHPTAKAIYSDIAKRPQNERTLRNKNIAIAYASLRILNNLLPKQRSLWDNEISLAGLDPHDFTKNLTTPIGIGNHVAESILSFRNNDGMNQNGENRVYNKARYENSVSYVPKNTAYELEYPDNWQPDIEYKDYGLYVSQVHVAPQLGNVIPYAVTDVDKFMSPVPEKSLINNLEGYTEQVQEILRESYTLDDRKKMATEYFEDKVWSLDGSLENIISQHKIDLDEYIFLHLAVKIALFDSGIVVWKEKLVYDTVRPFSAIRYLYENTTLKAWGGPGLGAVDDIKGRDWCSYLPTAPHSEYPSGSTCFCSAQAQTLRRYFRTNNVNHSITFQKGSSRIEPCITPSENITLQFHTYDEIVHACGLSRLYGGVHFLTAINEAEKLCKPVGDIAYEFVESLVNGKNTEDTND